MLILLKNTGDNWGQWGQSINTRVRSVPRRCPHSSTLGTRTIVLYLVLSPLLVDWGHKWGRFKPNKYGPVPTVPSVPTS
jgi:hypothetical protein